MRRWIVALALVVAIASMRWKDVQRLTGLGSGRKASVTRVTENAKDCTAWNDLGNEVANGVYSGSLPAGVQTALDCYLRAVACDGKLGAAWTNVGHQLGRTRSQATINGEAYSNVKAYQQAVEVDPQLAAAWISLASVMAPGDLVTVFGQQRDRYSLTIQGLEVSAGVPEGWYNLAVYIRDVPGRGHAVVSGVTYRPVDAALKAVAMMPHNGHAWTNLAHSMIDTEPVVDPDGAGRGPMTRLEVITRALTLTPEWPFAWETLAVTLIRTPPEQGFVEIGGDRWTAGSAFKKALEMTHDRSELWSQFGGNLKPGEVFEAPDGTLYESKDMFHRAVKVNPKNVGAWVNLCAVIPIRGSLTMADGTIVTRRDCFIQVLELNPDHAGAWNNVATELNPTEHATVMGERHTQESLLVTSIKLNPNDAVAWNNLGRVIEYNQTTLIDGTEWDRKALHHRAIDLDEWLSDAWNNLGLNMVKGEYRVVRGVNMSRDEIFQRRHLRPTDNN
jgi:hypothetical protein